LNWSIHLQRTGKNASIAVSVLTALSIRDYVKLAAPGMEVFKLIGEESKRKGTDKLTSRQIDQVIKTARAQKIEARMIPLRLVRSSAPHSSRGSADARRGCKAFRRA